jgi:hypothetical protein
MTGVGISTGKEVVDQGQGGGKKVRSSVPVCVMNVPLTLPCDWELGLSLNVMGSSVRLGNRVLELLVTSVPVMFQFHHGMLLAVIAGIENVVVWIVRAIVVVTVGWPETVTVLVVVQATSIGVTKGSTEKVVGDGNVEGATMILTGAIAVAVFESLFESLLDSTIEPST